MILAVIALATSTNTTANIVAATSGVAAVLTSLALLIPTLRSVRETKADVHEVHKIVNQQRTDAQRYQVALVELLKLHGIEVPIDQSLPVADSEIRQAPAPGVDSDDAALSPDDRPPPLVMKEVREDDEPT